MSRPTRAQVETLAALYDYDFGKIVAHLAEEDGQDLAWAVNTVRTLLSSSSPVRGGSRTPEGAEMEPVTLPEVPAYPARLLAGPLSDLVSSTTLPPGLVAGAGLGALAGLCGQADLVMPDESRVRPVLWIPLVAPRGAGKTPAMDKAFGALRELDAAEHDRYRAELSDWATLPGKERGNMPPDTTRRIDDATLETVARWLDRGDGTGVVESDELSGWLQSIGQYKRISGDKGRWLAMWSAQPWRYQRVGADRSGAIGIDVYIQHPVVSVVGGIQPHLHPLLGDPDSGFRPRWLPHLAPLKTVTWGSRIHPPAEWDKAIESLYTARYRREWELAGDALGIWQRECAEWKRQARGSENTSASAALDKSDIQCARVALVIAESMSPGAGGIIPAPAMECAVAIIEYVMNCWRALPGHEAFALSRRDEILARKVDELSAWLDTRNGRKATRTQIKEAAIAGVRSAADAETLLTAYEAVYPGTVIKEHPAGGGRPGQVVHAPPRGTRTATTGTPAYAAGISERSEIPAEVMNGSPRQIRSSAGVTEFPSSCSEIPCSETPCSETPLRRVTEPTSRSPGPGSPPAGPGSSQ